MIIRAAFARDLKDLIAIDTTAPHDEYRAGKNQELD